MEGRVGPEAVEFDDVCLARTSLFCCSLYLKLITPLSAPINNGLRVAGSGSLKPMVKTFLRQYSHRGWLPNNVRFCRQSSSSVICGWVKLHPCQGNARTAALNALLVGRPSSLVQ